MRQLSKHTDLLVNSHEVDKFGRNRIFAVSWLTLCRLVRMLAHAVEDLVDAVFCNAHAAFM